MYIYLSIYLSTYLPIYLPICGCMSLQGLRIKLDFRNPFPPNTEKRTSTTFYPLVNIPKTMENHHAIHGKINYKWAMFNSFLYVYQRVSIWSSSYSLWVPTN